MKNIASNKKFRSVVISLATLLAVAAFVFGAAAWYSLVHSPHAAAQSKPSVTISDSLDTLAPINQIDSTSPLFPKSVTCTASGFSSSVVWSVPSGDNGTITSVQGSTATLLLPTTNSPSPAYQLTGCTATSQSDPSVSATQNIVVVNDYAVCSNSSCADVCSSENGLGCGGFFSNVTANVGSTGNMLTLSGGGGQPIRMMGLSFDYGCPGYEGGSVVNGYQGTWLSGGYCTMNPAVNPRVVWTIPLPTSTGAYQALEGIPLQGSFPLTETNIGADGEFNAVNYAPGGNYQYQANPVNIDISILRSFPGSYSIFLQTTDSLGHNVEAEYGFTVTQGPPSGSISANPKSITSGSSTTLSWQTSGASSATITDNVDSNVITASPASSGSVKVSPSGTTVYTLNMTGSGGTATATTTVTVSAPPSGTGMVYVNSVNSSASGTVPSVWDVTASLVPGMDVCLQSNISCYGTSRSYSVPALGVAKPDVTGVIPSSTSAGRLYVLRGVEQNDNIASNKNKSVLSGFLALSRDLLGGVARAQTVCSYIGTPGQTCPTADFDTSAQSIVNPGDNANYTILWDPVAAMSVSPSSILLSAPSNPSGTATITNTGAPGSTLNWSAQTSYAGTQSGWLSLSSSTGSVTNGNSSGATQSVTLTASSASLSNGTYTATTTFTGTPACSSEEKKTERSPCGPSTSLVSVTLTVSGLPPGCSGPSCPQGGNSSTTITVTANPSAITLGGSTQVTVESQNATSCTESGSWSGSTCGPNTVTETPTSVGTYTYQASATGSNGSAQGSATVTVTAPPGCVGAACQTTSPTCSLTASPSTVTPGGKSELSYDCENVTPSSCYLSGGQFGNYTNGLTATGPSSVQGSVSVMPTGNTLYSVNCNNSAAEQSVQVTVSNPNLNETNP